ncbi:hypothetical protein ACH47C_41460 [Streptomyces rishiriensis]|uniref:transposase family protein n=1 Tax=Streptomyces rishiriensis TaxID=68264 RepID=UPI001FE47049
MRHALVGVLALVACAVLAGSTSLLAVGEWITDATPHILEHVACDPNGFYLRKRRSGGCCPESATTLWTWPAPPPVCR